MDTNLRKKRILYRSTHRGCKEMDILIGNFMEKNLETLTEAEIEQAESILELPDLFLFNCYQSKSKPPKELTLLNRMISKRKE